MKNAHGLFKLALLSLCFGASLLTASFPTIAEEGYYQYPTMHGGTVVFSSEGDLWRQDRKGGQAVRLTTHAGVESQAHLSPDGKTVAFRASFDDQTQVYVMPLSGGMPKQVSFELTGVVVRGWSPDGRVLYTSRDTPGSSRVRELRLVDPDTLDVERIPLRYATTGDFSADGTTLFFTRHGMSTVNDNARIYRGGGMSQLWRFELGDTKEAIRLAPDFGGPIDHPMVWKGRVYFLSDESGWDNIWSMKPDGSDIKQHTSFSGWRLQDPTLDDGAVLYQRGADLYRYDIRKDREEKILIDLATDKDRSRNRFLKDPLRYLESAGLGAKNKRVAITARGNVLITGTDKKRRISLNLPEGARARGAVLDAKGEHVYLILGLDAESEIWRFKADGSDDGEQLTKDATQHRWDLRLTPNDKYLLHTDKARRLFMLDLESGENTLLQELDGPSDNPFEIDSFSPDGRYVAISAATGFTRAAVQIIDLKTKEIVTVTSKRYSSYDATFSADGDWLYFLSDRQFRPTPGSPWGDRNMGVQFDKRTQVFALALKEDLSFPFAAATELDDRKKEKADNREEDKPEDKPKNKKPEDQGEEKGAKPATEIPSDGQENEDAGKQSDNEDEKDLKDEAPAIDWQAAAKRLYQVPVGADNYSGLTAVKGRLFVLQRGANGAALKTLKITNKAPKWTTFVGGVRAFSVSDDGKNILYISGFPPKIYLVPAGAKAPQKLADFQVKTNGWKLALNPSDEWSQQFLDGWRMHRDFSFDPAMRGVDWEAVRDQLLPLAARIGHRTELDDLFSQMAYPLGILHSQIVGGETPRDEENGQMATLGAQYEKADNGVAIRHIFGHEFERPSTAGPLMQSGQDFAVGDIITRINARPVSHPSDIAKALINQAGEQVLIAYQRDGEEKEAVVIPQRSNQEFALRYQDWVLSNALKVKETSGGKVGYLHLRAMGAGDVASFARDFFAQNTLEGMIIDVRDNNGGNIDSIIISQLLRRVWAFWEFEPGHTYGNMQETFRGHLAVLANAGTYSDGDTFSAAVKALKLGPVIGERTAGAGIWLSGRNGLSDGGRARIAETPQYDLDGNWMVEGRGVSPDMEVVAGPYALYQGKDAQIDAAVSYLLKKIADEPIPVFKARPLPLVGEYGVDSKPID